MNLIKTNSGYKIVGLWLILSMTMALSLSAAPLKIMMLGDSITEGIAKIPDTPKENTSTYASGDYTSVNDSIGYRGELWDLLKEAGYQFGVDIDFVGSRTTGSSYNGSFNTYHEGHGGFNSRSIKDGIDGWLDDSPADIVLLHVGANDWGHHIPIGTDNDTNENNDTSVNNIKKILTSIFTANPNSKVFVARIIEVRRAEAWGGWRTKAFNDAIENMVKNHPKRSSIKMVDMESGAGMIYDPCGTKDGDMQPFHTSINGDGVATYAYDYHPNKNGYIKMANKWYSDMIESKWLPNIEVPVITLLGDNPHQVTVGATYQDPGAVVSDTHDENRSIIGVGTVDINTEGNYTITYNANDTAGNAAIQVTRTVTVLPDTNNNGIPDDLEQDWFDYDKASQTATITPLAGGAQSVLTIEGLTAIPEVTENTVALTHTLGGGIKAYIKALETGLVNTGFIQGAVDDSTLKTGTSFKAGTKSVIKSVKGKVTIETEVTLNKDESLTIGE